MAPVSPFFIHNPPLLCCDLRGVSKCALTFLLYLHFCICVYFNSCCGFINVSASFAPLQSSSLFRHCSILSLLSRPALFHSPSSCQCGRSLSFNPPLPQIKLTEPRSLSRCSVQELLTAYSWNLLPLALSVLLSLTHTHLCRRVW